MIGASFPLFDRPAGAVMFAMPDRSVGPAGFLRDVRRVAALLPDRPFVANVCQHRYWVTVCLGAALLRGQTTLLSGEPSPGALARAATEFPEVYAITDEAACLPHGSTPMPVLLIAREPAPGGAPGAVPQFAADQPAVVVSSSGTTGVPVRTHKSWGELVARSRAAADRFGLTEDAPVAVIGTVPPNHMYGLETTVLLPLHAGVSSWCGPAFFPGDIGAVPDSPAARMIVTTPVHLRALLGAGPMRAPPRWIVSATAPLDRDLAEAAERRFGCEVLEIFGATEVGSIASRRTVRDEAWSLYPDVALTDDEPPMVRAPFAAARPLNDVIEAVPGGRFRLLGRSADLVKRAGRRASLQGLSRILCALPGVRDGAFLAPDDLDARPTARLLAFAVAPGCTAAGLTEALRAEIDPVFLPRPLVLLDELPRDALGKLPRAALLARAGAA